MKYKVFKGFKKVKETSTILDAKNTNEGDGVYNIIGENYSDSFQIVNGKIY